MILLWLKISGLYIREIAPEKEKIVKVYKSTLPIFDHFGINKQIKGSLRKDSLFQTWSISYY